MPNGFIELNNTDIYCIRWTGYDEIIKIALRELDSLTSSLKKESLVNHLESRIPPANFNDRLEMRWGFIDEMTHTTVSRSLELYNLCEETLDLFWSAMENGYSKLIECGEDYSTLHPTAVKELLELKPKCIRN